MTGPEYEQFVRVVLAKRLKMSPGRLISRRVPGATLPEGSGLKHQIDLMYFHESDFAEYLTIVECKYRGSAFVDQPEIQNLAFVKENVRAHKAIMATNNGFTSGAIAVAESQRIGLLVITPQFDVTEPYDDVCSLFALMERKVSSQNSHNVVICHRLGPDPNSKGTDLIEGLLSDPEVARTVQGLLRDPGIRRAADQVLRSNPDLARAARKFLGGGW